MNHQQNFKEMLDKKFIFNYNDAVNPKFITCFNCDKLLTFPLLVLSMAGFSLSCLNKPFHLTS